MKAQLAILKSELKVLAETIKTTKPNYRKSQSIYDKSYPERHDWHQRKILERDEEYIKVRNTCWGNMSTLDDARFKYRAKHIAYCMLRGKTLEQIEPKLKDPNSFTHYRVRKEASTIVKQILEATSGETVCSNT